MHILVVWDFLPINIAVFATSDTNLDFVLSRTEIFEIIKPQYYITLDEIVIA